MITINVNGEEMNFSKEQLSNILGEYFAERSPIHEIRRRNMAEKPTKVMIRNNKGFAYSCIKFDNGVEVYCWDLWSKPLENDRWYDISEVEDICLAACFGTMKDRNDPRKLFTIMDLIPI